jgi:hypothetical protein
MSVKIGEGERILATAIIQQFTLRADGEFEPLVALLAISDASERYDPFALTCFLVCYNRV